MPLVWPARVSTCCTLRQCQRSLFNGNFRYLQNAERGFCSTVKWNADVIPLRKKLKDATKASRSNRSLESESRSSLSEDVLNRWELTVGIEIHAQLNTARKLFSLSPSENDVEPNDKISAFDISLPGSLPRFQTDVLIPAIRAAIALKCRVQNVSRFDRKHYFYHDQPAGYQITQYYQPFARNGKITLAPEDGIAHDEDPITIGIKQIQLEQDTAKTQELEDGTNLIDFSRSGQPLIEIISLPHIHTPEAAAAYVRKIQAILYSIDAVTTGMEFGGLRADVNVSVRRIGNTSSGMSYGGVEGLGQRTEIKNLSSFRAVEEAIKAERDRQIQILEDGGVIEGETRGWSITDPAVTRRLRGKEGEVDYRYMPDADVPPLYIGNDLIYHLEKNLPAIPEQLQSLLTDSYGLTKVDSRSLIGLDDGERLDYFQRVVHACTNNTSQYPRFGKIAGNWVLHEIGSLLTANEVQWSKTLIPPRKLAQIIKYSDLNRITTPSAKKLLKMIFDQDEREIDQIINDENLWFESLSDEEYSKCVDDVIKANQNVVDDIQNKGKLGKIQFLVGQVMRSGLRNRMEASRIDALLRSRILPSGDSSG